MSTLEIVQYVRINQKNQANGEFRYQLKSQYQGQYKTLLQLTDSVWSENKTYQINRLFLDFLYGGNGEQWNPQHDSSLLIGNTELSRPLRRDF